MKQKECPMTPLKGQSGRHALNERTRYQMAVEADMEVGMKMGAIKPAPYDRSPVYRRGHGDNCHVLNDCQVNHMPWYELGHGTGDVFASFLSHREAISISKDLLPRLQTTRAAMLLDKRQRGKASSGP